MKVAQLTTTLEGGAGIAALRISAALRTVGVNSKIISQNSANDKTKLMSKIITLTQRTLVQSHASLITTISLNAIDLNSLEDYDVVHFHSIYNLVNTKSITEFVEKKPIVLTLHDQRMLTGGCHYSDSCMQFQSNCSRCPQTRRLFWKSISKEKDVINRLLKNPNVSIVSPSKWLARLASDVIPAGKSIHVIRNPIPSVSHSIYLKDRTFMGLEEKDHDGYVIGFVAANLSNPLKGLQDLLNALSLIPLRKRNKIQLLLVGKNAPKIDIPGIRVSLLSYTVEDLHINPYSFMDLLVVPSRQDNSPNVIGEAFMNGTRVLGSNVGGIPELLADFDCTYVDTTDASLLSNAIENEIIGRKSALNLIEKSNNVFGFQAIGESYKKLYEQVT
jgi:glycosyltransferase involved in cell wall biosynthesis